MVTQLPIRGTAIRVETHQPLTACCALTLTPDCTRDLTVRSSPAQAASRMVSSLVSMVAGGNEDRVSATGRTGPAVSRLHVQTTRSSPWSEVRGER